MNCHFSDEKSLIWRLEFLLSRQIGNGGTEKLCHKVTEELHIRAKDKLEQVWWKVIKKFSEGILQILYLFQTFQWPDSSFIFYQEK